MQNEAAAHLLFLAGENLVDRGWYLQAEPLCKQALQLYERLFGPDHNAIIGSLALLSVLYMRQREFSLFEPLERRLDAIVEQKSHGASDAPTTFYWLARRYIGQGKLDLAILFCQQALQASEQDAPLALQEKATICDTLGKLYMVQKDYMQARTVCELQKRCYEQLPAPDCYQVTESLRSLAHIAMVQGELRQAEQLVRQAQGIDMQVLEADHPDIAHDIELLGVIAERRGHYNEAEQFMRQALAMFRKRLGPNAYAVAVELGNLAAVLSKQEQNEQATFFYQQAEEIFERREGFVPSTYVNFLRSYAAHLKKIGQEEDALQHMHLVRLIEDQWAQQYGGLLSGDEVLQNKEA